MSDTGRLWDDAVRAAALFAMDPAGLGGVLVRSPAGPVRDRWLAMTRAARADAPWRRLPARIADDRLVGGMDLTATLAAGRPILARGVLAEADGGVLVLPMAERTDETTVARISAALDRAEVVIERDGVAARCDARFGLIALDESAGDDERPSYALQDRLAFHLDLSGITMAEAGLTPELDAQALARARCGLGAVSLTDEALDTLCAVAAALGIDSMRAPLLAAKAARCAAAFEGRTAVAQTDLAFAARVVLAPRATVLPEAAAAEPPAAEPQRTEEAERPDPETAPPDLQDVVLSAAAAAIPKGLLLRLLAAGSTRSMANAGRAGAPRTGGVRGRPIASRPGRPGVGLRVDVIDTLRAAAPWQPLRRRGDAADARLRIAVDDLRIKRFKQRRTTTTVFVVDASGSSALHRLAEAKGAVELLLAECYVRRDRVALVAFRGVGAEVLLPPTRSLVRAKRLLAALPGGGATPLAAGLDAAAGLADQLRRVGDTPVVVLLTDGRANVARNGSMQREQAALDARAAARRLRAAQTMSVWLDTSAQPQPQARALAEEMGARYLPLPYADASAVAHVARAVR